MSYWFQIADIRNNRARNTWLIGENTVTHILSPREHFVLSIQKLPFAVSDRYLCTGIGTQWFVAAIWSHAHTFERSPMDKNNIFLAKTMRREDRSVPHALEIPWRHSVTSHTAKRGRAVSPTLTALRAKNIGRLSSTSFPAHFVYIATNLLLLSCAWWRESNNLLKK